MNECVLIELKRTILEFEDHQTSPWGVVVNFADPVKTWYAEVSIGKQFYSKGVRSGWLFFRVNDLEMIEMNREEIKHILKGGRPCTVEFKVTYLQ